MVKFSDSDGDGSSAPRAAFWLGVAGTAPFAVLAFGIFFIPQDRPQDDLLKAFLTGGLMSYGAIILSFLGGVRWGVALFTRDGGEQAFELSLSIAPVLIAWPAVLMQNPAVALTALTFGFGLQAFFDVRAVRRGALPVWYGHLRIQLTIAVVTALLFAAISLL